MNRPSTERVIATLAGILEVRYGLELSIRIRDKGAEKPFIFTNELAFSQDLREKRR